MTFQQTVNTRYAFGMVGERFLDSPSRVESLIMNSAGTANTIGNAFTKNNQSNLASVGGTPATSAAAFTAGISTTNMTVSAVASGTLAPGDLLLTGAAAGTTIVSQTSGTTGGTGVYVVSISQTVAGSTSFTSSAQGPGTVFAGILVNPKVYASVGTTAGTLVPTLVLPDNTQGEFATMGDWVVKVVGPANIGDLVQFNTSTGALSTVAPGASAAASNILVPNGVIYRYPTVATGLTVLRMTN